MDLTTIFNQCVIYTLMIWNNLLTFNIGNGCFGNSQILRERSERIIDDRIEIESNRSRTAHKSIYSNNYQKISPQNVEMDLRYVCL